MYSSVTKVDIAFTDKDGTKVALQTDHRDAAEIEAEWDLSVLFAAARLLNARRAIPDVDRIRFAFMSEPPAAMCDLLRRSGAEVETSPGTVLTQLADGHDALFQQVNACALALGAAVFARHGVEADKAGLGKVCLALRANAGTSADESEIDWWTACIELSCATLVAAKRLKPQLRVVADTKNYATLPFLLDYDGGLLNAFSKAERYLQEGESETPVGLLTMLQEQDADEGDVMFNLRPADWHAKGVAMILPLLDGPAGESVDDLPLLSLCVDLPNTTKTIPTSESADEIARQRALAEASIKKVEVQTTEIGTDDLRLFIVHSSFYASEKLFDRGFMEGLQKKLGGPILVAAVPCKGRLLVTRALVTPGEVEGVLNIVTKMREEAAPNQRLSRQLFLWSEGNVVGLVKLSQRSADEGASNRPPEPDQPQGFFKRWFGW